MRTATIIRLSHLPNFSEQLLDVVAHLHEGENTVQTITLRAVSFRVADALERLAWEWAPGRVGKITHELKEGEKL